MRDQERERAALRIQSQLRGRVARRRCRRLISAQVWSCGPRKVWSGRAPAHSHLPFTPAIQTCPFTSFQLHLHSPLPFTPVIHISHSHLSFTPFIHTCHSHMPFHIYLSTPPVTPAPSHLPYTPSLHTLHIHTAGRPRARGGRARGDLLYSQLPFHTYLTCSHLPIHPSPSISAHSHLPIHPCPIQTSPPPHSHLPPPPPSPLPIHRPPLFTLQGDGDPERAAAVREEMADTEQVAHSALEAAAGVEEGGCVRPAAGRSLLLRRRKASTDFKDVAAIYWRSATGPAGAWGLV